MRKTLRSILKPLGILIVLAAVAGIVPSAPSGHAATPYLSAFSALSVSPALAASTCQNRGCELGGLCNHTKGSNCRRVAGECQATAC